MPIFLNWIWQGSALTLLVALVVCRLRAVNAATRERIWWATLAAVCLMPFVSLLGLAPAAKVAAGTDAALLITVPEPSSLLVGTAWMIWMASVAVSGLRLAIAVIALGRAKRSAAPFPAARLDALTTWARVSSHGRQARLAVSDRVTTAAVLGLGRPVIAVSPDALDRLTDDELDDILVHEYAHVQRFDDLGVLAQRALGAIFGLHPAVWWLGRALTLEREVACDDLVLAQTRNSPQRYARSLVRLVEQTGRQTRLRLAPGAIVSRPQLTRRIVRLLDRTAQRERETVEIGDRRRDAAIGVGRRGRVVGGARGHRLLDARLAQHRCRIGPAVRTLHRTRVRVDRRRALARAGVGHATERARTGARAAAAAWRRAAGDDTAFTLTRRSQMLPWEPPDQRRRNRRRPNPSALSPSLRLRPNRPRLPRRTP